MTQHRALLIGNSTFPLDSSNLQSLEGPVNDIAVLRAALTDRTTGLFESDMVRILPERGMDKILEEMEAFFTEARRDDQLLLYYSGHGLLDDQNQLYLCAQNTRIDRLKSTAVSAGTIDSMIRSSAAQTTVIMLDCCHSGAFKGGISPEKLSGSGRFVLTSCRSGQLANDATRRNGTSRFTQHLVDGLLGKADDYDEDGLVDIDDIYDYVHRQLRAEQRQIPQRNFAGSGEAPLARRSSVGVPGRDGGPSTPARLKPVPKAGPASVASARPAALDQPREPSPRQERPPHDEPVAAAPPRRQRAVSVGLGAVVMLALATLLIAALVSTRDEGGAERLRVPEVVGLDSHQATAIVRAAGFAVRVLPEDYPYAAFPILAQDPAGGTTAERGNTVTLTLATPATAAADTAPTSAPANPAGTVSQGFPVDPGATLPPPIEATTTTVAPSAVSAPG